MSGSHKKTKVLVAGSTGFIKQDVTAVSGTTTINLNDGNIIYLTHSNNTTIAFSNVKTADDVTIIRIQHV